MIQPVFIALSSVYLIQSSALPNFVHVLADDLGYYSIGYKNSEILSPNIDELAATGVKLNEFYTYQYCSPTRGALLTGRYPWKTEGIRSNLEPLVTVDGLNLGYTLLPERLKEKGYATHHLGKWHLGFADYRYTPTARGFDTSNGFFAGQEAHFTQKAVGGDAGQCGSTHTIYDTFKNGVVYSQGIDEPNDQKYTSDAVDIIWNHQEQYGLGGEVPLYLCVAYNTPHSPIEALPEYLNLYPNISYTLQKTFYAMVSSLDDGVGNITRALKESGLWNNTIFIWHADNGSPIAPTAGGVCGSNYPLRGAKSSNWEGGVRAVALVNGGYLPAAQQGVTLSGIGHVSDWYATFLTLAGLNPHDSNPLSPSPVDGVNFWPWISGQVASSPRTTVVLDHNFLPTNGSLSYGAIRVGDYKLLVGAQPFASCLFYQSPCLFDVVNDPTEHHDLATTFPTLVTTLLATFRSYDTAYHLTLRAPHTNTSAYCNRLSTNGYIAAPFTTVTFPTVFTEDGYSLTTQEPTVSPTQNLMHNPSISSTVAPFQTVYYLQSDSEDSSSSSFDEHDYYTLTAGGIAGIVLGAVFLLYLLIMITIAVYTYYASVFYVIRNLPNNGTAGSSPIGTSSFAAANTTGGVDVNKVTTEQQVRDYEVVAQRDENRV